MESLSYICVVKWLMSKGAPIWDRFLGALESWKLNPMALGSLALNPLSAASCALRSYQKTNSIIYIYIFAVLLMDCYTYKLETLYQITWVLNCFFSFLINFLFGPQKLFRPFFKLRATPLTWCQPFRSRHFSFVWLFLTRLTLIFLIFGSSHCNRVTSRTAKWLQRWHWQPLLALEAQNPYIKFQDRSVYVRFSNG